MAPRWPGGGVFYIGEAETALVSKADVGGWVVTNGPGRYGVPIHPRRRPTHRRHPALQRAPGGVPRPTAFFFGLIADRKGFVYHPDYFVAKPMPPFMRNLFRQSSKTIQFIPPYFQFLLAAMSGFRTELFSVATSAF